MNICNIVSVEMFQVYASKSGLRCFSYAQTNNFYERMMWYIITMICVIMTVWDVVYSTQYYLSFPTTTNVMLVDNTSLNFGSPVMCITFHNYWKHWKQNKIEKEEIIQFLDRFEFMLQSPFNALNKSSVIIPFVRLLMAVVSSITRAQYSQYDRNVDNNYDWGFVETENMASSVVELRGTIEVSMAAKWLELHNVSINKVVHSLAEILCRLSYFEIKKTPRLLAENCEIFSSTWLGTSPMSLDRAVDLACYKIPAKFVEFTSAGDNTYIRFERPAEFISHRDMSYLTMDFSENPTICDEAENAFWQTTETRMAIKMSVFGHYRQLYYRRKPCTEDEFPTLCKLKCINKFIRSWYGCNPVPTISKEAAEMRECSVNDFKRKLLNNCSSMSYSEILNKCYQECHRKCHRYSYYTVEKPLPLNIDNRTAMAFSADSFSYPQFEEVPLFGPKQYLSSLGGNLSLYLGANFMILYYTVFYWVTTTLATINSKLNFKIKITG